MGQPSGANHAMAQPTVTVLPVRKSSTGSTLLFGAVALAVLVHRLGTWGAFDPTAYVRFVPQPLLGMSWVLAAQLVHGWQRFCTAVHHRS
jgi:hypothetical protein